MEQLIVRTNLSRIIDRIKILKHNNSKLFCNLYIHILITKYMLQYIHRFKIFVCIGFKKYRLIK